MRKRVSRQWLIKLMVVFLVGVLSGCAHLGQVGSPVAAKSVVVPVKETAAPLKVELPNGMVVILKESHDSPVVAMQACFKTGSIHENEYLGSGITHAVEHMLFKNTQKRGVGAIAQEIHNAGGELNGYTSFDAIVFHLVVASRYFDTGLDVLSDAIMNSAMDEGEWQKEQQVIMREIIMNEDDPSKYMYKKIWSVLFEKHPYHYPVIGEKEIFSRLTIEDVRDYYRSRFVPNNMILVVVGDFDQAEVLEKIKAAFKDYAPRSLPPAYLPEEPRQVAPRVVELEKDVKVARLSLGFHTVDVRSPDIYALDVMAMILGQGRTSRLYQSVKEKGLAYSVSAWSYTPSSPGIFGVSAELEAENLAKVEESVWAELAKFQKTSVTTEELQRAQQSVLAHYYFSGQDVEGIAGELLSDYYQTGNLDFSRLYVEGIKKVTPAQIKDVASRYFARENSTLVTMKPQSAAAQPETVEKTKAAGFNFKDSFQKFKLANGIELLVKENFNAPIVSVQTFSLGGTRFETEADCGVSNFLQGMLKRGTKTRSAKQIAMTLETMGASLSTDSGSNSCYNQLNVLAQDFSTGVELMADVIKNPTFPSEEMEKLRADILAGIKKQDEDIFPVAIRLFRETYFTDHPYRLRSSGTVDSITKLTRADLSEFYQRIYNPQKLVIMVVGAVKAEQAKQIIEQNFAALPAAPYTELTLTPQAPPVSAKEAIKYLPEKEQALLLLGFPGTEVKSPDIYAYELMNALLSGQGGRLFQELRDKQSLAYYVGTFNILGLERGSYVFYIGTTPDKVAQAEAGFWAEIERLKNEPVAAEELERAKRALIGQKEINLQTNAEQGFSAGLDELYGLGYDNLDNYAAAIEKVTASDLQNLAQTNFVKDHSVKVVVQSPQE